MRLRTMCGGHGPWHYEWFVYPVILFHLCMVFNWRQHWVRTGVCVYFCPLVLGLHQDQICAGPVHIATVCVCSYVYGSC